MLWRQLRLSYLCCTTQQGRWVSSGQWRRVLDEQRLRRVGSFRHRLAPRRRGKSERIAYTSFSIGSIMQVEMMPILLSVAPFLQLSAHFGGVGIFNRIEDPQRVLGSGIGLGPAAKPPERGGGIV
jgi:hypothetical protein